VLPRVQAVRVHDAPRHQARAAGQDGLQRPDARLLQGGEDRRARLQRRGQVDAAQDHGRPGRRHLGRRPAASGRHGRLPRAGAAPGRVQDGEGERRGRRAGDEAPARALQRARDELLRRDRGRVRRAAGEDRRGRRVEPRHPARVRDGRPALPAAGVRGHEPLGRRAPPRGPVPAAALPARPAAPRRADEPPGRRLGLLARAAPRRLPRRRRGRDPRPVLPGQRRGLDPRARPRQGHPLRGQLHRLAAGQGEAPAAGGPPGQGAPAPDLRRARVGAHEPQGAADEVQGPPGPLRGARGRRAAAEARGGHDPHPAGAAAGRHGHRGRQPAQGLRRQAPLRRPLVLPAARGDRRRGRRERRGQDDAVQAHHGPGAARRRLDHRGRHGAAGLRRPVPRRPGPEQDRLGGDHGRPGLGHGRQAGAQLAPVRGGLQLQEDRPAEEGRQALRRRAQPGPPGQAPAPRRQPAASRRADERPGRGDPAGAGERAPAVLGLRGGHLPRSLVPGPHRHPRPRLRGRVARGVVPGELRGLRGVPPHAPGRGGRPAPPPAVQEAHADL
ncbi:MAG: Energy-dependent translational throttle protein EttA, partial [uncultured Solirubrobacteraceae bacterium]